ncbi:hypothetical protein ACQP0C_07095 [Nocardia sp. CA-129566]|uniref:hypothetical protein n=1 Tax=Nocardia sp. CA-129566 TaxID=3239976 RepID=UPI003D96A4B1
MASAGYTSAGALSAIAVALFGSALFVGPALPDLSLASTPRHINALLATVEGLGRRLPARPEP